MAQVPETDIERDIGDPVSRFLDEELLGALDPNQTEESLERQDGSVVDSVWPTKCGVDWDGGETTSIHGRGAPSETPRPV
ncbi:MAG: hypothetical protein ACRD2Z_16410 [Thermoanaerobaculia bacterium]